MKNLVLKEKKFKLIKKLKENSKTMLTIIITTLIVGSTVTFASYSYFAKDIEYRKNDGTKISVENALNELYNKRYNVEFPYIENIWSSSAQSVSYTYTVEKDGIYLASVNYCNESGIKGNITTTADEKIVKNMEFDSRFSIIKIVNATTNDTIKVSGYNGAYSLNAFIVKLNNINVSEIIASNISCDSTAKCEYTATNDDEKVLVISIATATNRSNSIIYNSNYLATYSKNNNDYIDYAILKKGTSVTTTAYGYNWGGGVTYILK